MIAKILVAPIFILIFLQTFHLFSQNTFQFTITDSLTDEIINDVIELDNGSYILACNQLNPLPSWKVHMVKLTPSGRQSGTVEFNFQDQSSGFMKILKVNPDLLVLAGYTLSEGKYKIWLYEMDSLFNEIHSNMFSLDTCSLSSLNALMDESGNILCYGINNDSQQTPYAFIYRISSALDSVQYKMYSDHFTYGQPALLRKQDQSGFFFFLPAYRNLIGATYEEAILDIDNTFSINQISGVPNRLTEFPNAKWINNKDYILTSRRDSALNPNDRCIGVMVLDTNESLDHELYIGDHDTVEWPGIRKNLDFLDPNSIFIGSTHNFCQWEICATECWYSLTNMDSSLIIRWQKFYGGTANYTLWGLTATNDGGCLLYGTLYDVNTMNNERDVYVIKVNRNGLLGGTMDKINFLAHDAILYPNPGSDFLTIESGPQISGAEFRLISIDGKQVITKTLTERKIILDTQKLSPSIYVWNILFNGRVIETGKWIKE